MTDMTRKEHLQWCKDRALACLPDNPAEAVASMASDLTKHDGTSGSAIPMLTMVGMMAAQQGDIEGVRRWIDGFN